ncbi:MAG: PAS domain S-box protein [Oscillatoria sp. PMC 1068.18]|nr:PAS domain S-box protein [Oscillatoria sp. PMC 1076.18]MEC4991570.1 PAS domain S-box protein [Oscillatoria sp. PMC 1068.18]
MTDRQQNLLDRLCIKVVLGTENGELVSKILQLLMVIKELKFEVRIVTNLAENLLNSSKDRDAVTICLLDSQLGLELLSTIVEQSSSIPVIYLCENETKGEEALARGATDYLEKEQIGVREFQRSLRLTSKLAQTLAKNQAETQPLQENEAQFRHLAENIPAVSWLATPDFQQILYISPQYEQIWQYSRESLYDNPDSWLESIHPEDRQWMSETLSAVIEGNIPKGRDKEYRIVRGDGEIRWIRDRIFSLRTETGDIYRLAGISEDITDSKLVQLSLSKREHYLTTLVEVQRRLLVCSNITNCYNQILQLLGEAANADRVYIFETHFDENKRLLTSQKAEWCAPGIQPEIDNPLLQNIPYDQYFPRWQQALKIGNFINGVVTELPAEECDFLQEQGIFSILLLPLFVNDCFFGSIGFDNCTEARKWAGSEVALLQIAAAALGLKVERLLAQEELSQQERQFRTLTENSPQIIARFDRELRYVYINPAVKQATGIRPQKFLGRTNNDLGMLPELVSLLSASLEKVFQTGVEEFLEFEFATLQGLKSYKSRLVPEYSSDNYVEFVLAITQDITQEKLILAALRESEKRFRVIFEEAEVGIAQLSSQRQFLQVNQRFCDLFGYTETEISNLTWQEITNPEDLEISVALTQRMFAGEISNFSLEKRYLRKDGSSFWANCTISLVRSESGEPRCTIAVVQDITERKQAELQLRHRLDLETALAQVSRELATKDRVDLKQILGILGKVVGCDRAFLERFRDRGRFVDAIHEWCNEGVVSEIDSYQNLPTELFPWWVEQLNNNQAIVINDVRNLPARASREQQLLIANNLSSVLVVPIFSYEGQLWGSISFDNSTTNPKTWSEEDVQMLRIVGDLIYNYQEKQRSRLEQEQTLRDRQLLASLILKIRRSLSIDYILETAVTELQTTLAAQRVIFFRLFSNGSGQIVNEAVETQFPTMLGEIIFDENLYEYLDKYRNGYIYSCSDLAPESQPECYREWLLKHQIKANLVVPILMKPQEETLGISAQLWGLLCVQECSQTREWTSREIDLVSQFANQLGIAISQAELLEKQTQYTEDLRRSNAELEQFAYVASHDLQEPLQTIFSYVGLLEKRYSPQLDAKAQKYLYYIANSSIRMQALINDLLAYSRIGKNSQPFVLTDCNLVLEQAKANINKIIRQNQARIISNLLPSLIADSSQLVQLWQNLITNAIKYRSEASPVIKISATLEEDYWRFAFQDNGIGINPKYRDRIFQIFQRLHTQEEYPGTGIGLAICQKIVEGHGGKIWVESAESGGSIFYFTLPNSSYSAAR